MSGISHETGRLCTPSILINGMRKVSSASVDEDSADDQGMDDAGSPYNSTSGADRKRRRGMIEKRRRDRINCSLYDLKRLVPDNARKPGTAKLEKAEILQATVDFIQRLYREGHVLSAEARAVELRRAGFRDCLLEVNRILSSFDGVANVHLDAMRRSLLAHLHQYDQQRDRETKAYLAHVAAVTNAIATQSTVPTHSNTTPVDPGINAKHAKRGSTHPAPICPPTTSATTGCATYLTTPATTTTTTTVNRQYASVAQYPPYQDSRLFTNNIHRSPYTSFPNSCKISVKPNTYSPLKRSTCLDGSGYPLQNGAYYASSYPPAEAVDPSQTHGYPASNTQNHHPQQQYGSTYHPCSNPIGPNESQSTSSPPFHSTPDDVDSGTSPNLAVGKLPSSTSGGESSYSDLMVSGAVKREPAPQTFPTTAATPSKPPQTASTMVQPYGSMNIAPTGDFATHVQQQSSKLEPYHHSNPIYPQQSLFDSCTDSGVGTTSYLHTSTYHQHQNQNHHQQSFEDVKTPDVLRPSSVTGEHISYVPQWQYTFQTL